MSPAEIQSTRARLGWTQKKMGLCLAVSTRTIQLWEAGQRNPSGPASKLLEMLKKESHYETHI